MKSGLNFAHLLLLFVTLSACSRSESLRNASSPSDARPGQVTPDRVVDLTPGPLLEKLDKIQNDKTADPCDQAQDSIKRKLVIALDENSAKLEEESRQNNSNSASQSPGNPMEIKTIPFQGSHLLDLPKIEPGSTGWNTELRGWQSVHDFYKTNVDQPPPQFWTQLNQSIRSLLLEDQIRVLNGTNRGIDHENVVHIPHIKEAVEECIKNSNCTEPRFGGDTALAVKSIPMYRFFDQAIRSFGQNEIESRRDFIGRFKKRLEADLGDHGFRENKRLQVETSGNQTVLRLAMDPGALGESEQGIMKSIIESIWAKDGVRIELGWQRTQNPFDLFEVFFHADSPGERPYVMPGNKTMHLFPGTRTRSIAHEFGHVLGFDDHYYTVWDPDRCLYIYETNDSDLMSNSASGEVTPEEWRTLTGPEEKPAS